MGAAELAGLNVGRPAGRATGACLSSGGQSSTPENWRLISPSRWSVGRRAPNNRIASPGTRILTQHALKNGDKDAGLDFVNEGEKADCEHNEGRRRNDYELRRGQVHVKRGEADAAADVFQRLIERVPANLRYRGSAAEAMLTLKQGRPRLHFAEEGVTAARHANDRDSEQYLLELLAAAKKQMG